MTHDQLMDLRRDVIEVATKYIGTHEEGNNRGAFVDMVNQFVGNTLGSPWCAAGLCWSAHTAGAKNGAKNRFQRGDCGLGKRTLRDCDFAFIW